MKSKMRLLGFLPFMVILLFPLSCADTEKYIQPQTSQVFLQDFNPEFLDILWVIDDRSSLFGYRNKLVTEAKKFFARLDAATNDYQMGFITSDMRFAKGQLKPNGTPAIIKRNVGDVNQRTELFGSVLTQVIVNLQTDGESKGLQAAQASLSKHFSTRAGVPLVLIFISDADDHSDSGDPAKSALDYYADSFRKLKGNNPELLKVYAINYVSGGDRCTDSRYDADIDSARTLPDGSPYFQDRYFKLALELGGETADICSPFSEKISLSGLRLKTLSNRFKLDSKANPATISLNVFRGNEEFKDLKYSFDAATNEIVFDEAPPQGVTIQVSYQAG